METRWTTLGASLALSKSRQKPARMQSRTREQDFSESGEFCQASRACRRHEQTASSGPRIREWIKMWKHFGLDVQRDARRARVAGIRFLRAAGQSGKVSKTD